MKKVIVDILGGDKAPDVTIDGAIQALTRNKSVELVLVGDKDIIEPRIKAAGFEGRVEILHTTEAITCHDSPTAAIRQKPNSSIVLGQSALKDRPDCGAFVSAGSTGAVLTAAFMKIGRIEGVSRPALCPILPTKDGRGTMVLDVGANMDCKPINLVHFALMADVYMRAQGRENPRIGLLSVGTEDEKGNELTLGAFKLLKQLSSTENDRGPGGHPLVNFLGNAEARDVFSGKYDIIVCDGFAGNVLLKTMEGAGSLFSHELKKAVSGAGALLGKLMLARRLLKMKRSLSEDATGGAIFIGVKKPVIKAHGNSNATAVANAILLGARAGDMDLGEQIKTAIQNAAKIVGE